MKKPSKPKRKKTRRSINVNYGSLQSLLDQLPPGIDYREVEFELEDDGFYESNYVPYAFFTEIESDEDFNQRMRAYEAKLAEYTQWRKDNAEQIARKEEAARLKRESATEKKRLERVKKLKQELKKLGEDV